jgi:hypothetical protein
MATLSIDAPFTQITDMDGDPLKSGYVYVGVAGQDAETNPISVFWDEGLTVPAIQPIRTLNGYYSRSGTPSNLFCSADDFSITVKNKNLSLVYSELTSSNLNASKSQAPFVLASVADIEGLSLIAGQRYTITGYHPNTTVGGGEFVAATGRHNGGTVIDPDRAFPTDWTNQAQLVAWFADSGVDELCLVRPFEDIATPESFGSKGDYNGTSGTDDNKSFKQWLECERGNLEGISSSWYWLGEIEGDTSLASRTTDVDIDFKGAKVSCASDDSALFTSTSVLLVTDARASYKSVVFDDKNFATRGSGRGAVLLIVSGVSEDISGFTVDDVELVNAQSFGTFYCSDPATASISDVYINPNCRVTGVSDRGLTLGGVKHVRGGYRLKDFRRALFSQNSSDIDLDISVGNGSASSGNLLIYSDTVGFDLKDIYIKMVAESLYSCSVFVEDPSIPINNVNIDITAKSVPDLATEIIRVGEQDGANNWLSSGTFSTKDCSFRLLAPVDCLEFGVQTTSPNVGVIALDTKGSYSDYKGGRTAIFDRDSRFTAARLHDVADAAEFDLLGLYKTPYNFTLEVSVRVTDVSSGTFKDQRFIIQASFSSTDVLTIIQSATLYSQPVGGPNPTISLSTSGSKLLISTDTYTDDLITIVSISKVIP